MKLEMFVLEQKDIFLVGLQCCVNGFCQPHSRIKDWLDSFFGRYWKKLITLTKNYGYRDTFRGTFSSFHSKDC